jgi:hypothetical protein
MKMPVQSNEGVNDILNRGVKRREVKKLVILA